MDDDHYIPDPNNAHVDTSDIERTLIEWFHKDAYVDLIDTPSTRQEELEHRTKLKVSYDYLCQQLFYRLEHDPKQPDDDALVARLLTPEKFLWFVNDWSIHFSHPSAFDDFREGTLPEDLETAAYRILNAVRVPTDGFEKLVRQRMNGYAVSCWTHIDEHHDDHLLWHKYAGGETGVGISVRYGFLKECLRASPRDSGFVDYSGAFVRPLFSKRPIFRNEKEVRFVNGTWTQGKDVTDGHFVSPPVPVEAIKDKFRLRFSPDAPVHHREAVTRVWETAGGTVV